MIALDPSPARANVALRAAGQRLEVVIATDGSAFSTAHALDETSLWLRRGREHARQLGGELTLAEAAGEPGTRLRLLVPIRASDPPPPPQASDAIPFG